MNLSSTNSNSSRLSWWTALVLIAVATAMQAARISTVVSATGEMPFHSANDRSRWCSVAALGGFGQFEIDPLIQIQDPKTKRRTWATIDMVRHRGRDGKQHYYSSKPPLLSAMHAGVYAAVRSVTGLSLLKQPFTTARVILVLVNLIPLVICWWLWARYWQRSCTNEWTFTFAMAAMLWGTFTTTFANTLNNHLPGALSAGLSLWALLQIIEFGDRRWRMFLLAGLSAAMTAVCELPALAWTAAVSVLLLQIDFRRALISLSITLIPMAIAFAVVNYAAHGDLRPPYAHRAVGELVTEAENAGSVDALKKALQQKGFELSEKTTLGPSRTPGVRKLWDEGTQFQFAVVGDDGQSARIHHWDDWYDYPKSYWYPDQKKGVDLGEPSQVRYLFQTTFGHHGVFSLTPIWLFVPVGIWCVWLSSRGTFFQRVTDHRTQLMFAIAITTLICFSFYIARPIEDRNYGGVSCGFRWMFWFAPLWCWLLALGVSKLQSTAWRAAAIVALLISVFSATFPWNNPWTSPWLMQIFM